MYMRATCRLYLVLVLTSKAISRVLVMGTE
jgi:hypothetical protein